MPAQGDPRLFIQVSMLRSDHQPKKSLIAYELPEKAGNAYIRIQDANGKRIQDITLPQTRGMGTIEITGEMLSPGIYIYSLVVSGQVMESKRMVVAE